MIPVFRIGLRRAVLRAAVCIVLGAGLSAQSSAQSSGPDGRTTDKQAVVETTAGSFVIDLTPEAAPNQVAYFIKLAGDGTYEGTIFHHMVKWGIVQGGDPLTRDAANRGRYGSGGFNAVKAEARADKMTRGSVAASLLSGQPDSAGAQFFIPLADQPGLDGRYTVFGHVSDGIEVLQRISETPLDEKGFAVERIEIRKITIRDKPAEPFVAETAEELGTYKAVLDTSAGPITIEFFTNLAPNHVRQFLRLAAAGVYSDMTFHRVARGFVIQTGWLGSRQTPLTARQQALVHNLQPEFSETKHVKGIVSMARGDDPASATTSFFICTGPTPELDGGYTVFGHVTDGMAAVEAIEATPVSGETPLSRVDLKGVRIERR
jgi:peptidyl-prolyl cis-trans isomerase B (cyclophilin B)